MNEYHDVWLDGEYVGVVIANDERDAAVEFVKANRLDGEHEVEIQYSTRGGYSDIHVYRVNVSMDGTFLQFQHNI